MATNGGTTGPRRPSSRALPLRAKVAIAGIAGVAAAWLIPKGGTEPIPTPTPTPPGRLTAAEVPLSTIKTGVSFRTIDGVRVFLIRTGDKVVAFHGQATTNEGGSVFWCPKSQLFEGVSGGPWYEQNGGVYANAPRELDRIQVLVAAGRVTIFPHVVTRGATPPQPTPAITRPRPPSCTAAERVG